MRISEDLDDRPHPGVNAALKSVTPDWQVGTSGSWSFLRAAGGNENERPEIQTFGRRYRIPRDTI